MGVVAKRSSMTYFSDLQWNFTKGHLVNRKALAQLVLTSFAAINYFIPSQ